MKQLIHLLETMLDETKGFRAVAHAIGSIVANDAEARSLQEAFRLQLSNGLQVGDRDLYWGLESIDDAIVEVWRTVLDATQHPVLVARLGDLCWLRRAEPQPHLHARKAIPALISLSQRWTGLDAATCLRRAVHLSRNFHDQDALGEAFGIAEAAFERVILQRDKPGVAMRYLQLLAGANDREHRIDLTPHFANAKRQLGDNPDTLEQIIDLQRARLGHDPPGHRSLRQEAAQGYFLAAKGVSGLSGLHWLQKAKAIAHDMPDLREELLRFERAFDPSTINWQLIELPIDEIGALYQSEARGLHEERDWKRALQQWMALDPPSGNITHNRKLTAHQADAGVLAQLAVRMTLNAQTGQARLADTEMRRLETDLSEVELLNLQLAIEFIARPLLSGFPLRCQVGREEFQAWLSESGAPVNATKAFAEAMFDWWEGGDTLPCALTIAAAIEALVRWHAESRGIVVTTNALENVRGGVKGLGDLLEDMNGHLDDSWHRFLRIALVADEGENLRNRLFHGLLLRPHERSVFTLAWAATFLCRLPSVDEAFAVGP